MDKTEDLFFGKKKDLENMEVKTDEDLIEENISEEEIPDISDIPTDKPEFSDLEKDFFECNINVLIISVPFIQCYKAFFLAKSFRIKV